MWLRISIKKKKQQQKLTNQPTLTKTEKKAPQKTRTEQKENK